MDAAEVHRSAVVADTHNDLLMLVARREPSQWATYFGEHWLPQLRGGGVDLQVLPVFIDDEFRPEGALRETLRMIEAAYRISEGCADAVGLCRTGDELEEVLGSGRLALVLALEGCPQIDTDVELLETLARLGVRIVSLAHFGRSALADGSGEDATTSRLTRAGVEAVAMLECLGVLLDISHLGRSGVEYALELSTRPVIATHSSARALHDHHRNLDDAQIKGVAAGGGVICVNFVPGFLGAGEVTVDTIVDHLEHVVAVAGIDAVGLGPDFEQEILQEKVPVCDRPLIVEGIDVFRSVPGIDGPAGLPLLTERMLARGWSVPDVRQVLGENVRRLLTAEMGRAGGSTG